MVCGANVGLGRRLCGGSFCVSEEREEDELMTTTGNGTHSIEEDVAAVKSMLEESVKGIHEESVSNMYGKEAAGGER